MNSLLGRYVMMNKMEWEGEKQSFKSKAHTSSHNYAELKIGVYRNIILMQWTKKLQIKCSYNACFLKQLIKPGLITSHPVHQNSPDY